MPPLAGSSSRYMRDATAEICLPRTDTCMTACVPAPCTWRFACLHAQLCAPCLQLLALAEPRGPAGLPSPDPGAVLALACHVVMVHAGLQSTLPSGAHPANKYAPRAGWTREFKDEWRFRCVGGNKCPARTRDVGLRWHTSQENS